MLPKTIKFILIIFDLFGFYTESTPANRFKAIFYYISHFISVNYFTYFMYHITQYNFSLKILDVLNIGFQYFCSLITYWLIIADSLFNRNAQREFWKTCIKIYQFYGNQKYFKWRCFVFKFIKFNSVMTLLFLVIFISRPRGQLQFLPVILVVTDVTLSTVCYARIFQCLLYLEIIRVKLNIVEIEANKASIVIDTVKESMKKIREMYQMIFKMINNLNEIFGISHSLAILNCFYFLLADLNWNYSYLTYQLSAGKIGRYVFIELKYL